MPSSVLGVKIAESNLSPLSSLSPSVDLHQHQHQLLPFSPYCGRLGSSGRGDAHHCPIFPLLFNSSVSGLFLITWARCALSWEKTPDGGWGPGSDFTELDISYWHSDCIFLPLTSVSHYAEFILNTILFCFAMFFFWDFGSHFSSWWHYWWYY